MERERSSQEAATASRRVFSVCDLARGIKGLLEEEVGLVWVAGEISDFFRARSGHCYFTLKDDRAQLRAVLFRGNLARIPFDPENGLEVVVQAELSFYEPRGDVQMIVRQLEPRGQGALQLAFEQLRERLAAEGLFDPELKRELPAWPRRIGIVTSPAGAALRDVIEVSGRRAGGIPLVVSPTRVQGEGAEIEIDAALRRLRDVADVDLILLVRGGGSLEDLMAFNSERVARAIRASLVPVIAGVGHEVDVTIADMAADARAPTPSAAAELAVPDLAPLRMRLRRELDRLDNAWGAQFERASSRLDRLTDGLHAFSPSARLARQRERLDAAKRGIARVGERTVQGARSELSVSQQRLLRAGRQAVAEAGPGLDALAGRLARVMPEQMEGRHARLREQVGRLHALSPLAVLARGFSIVRGPEGEILRHAADVEPDARLEIQLAEGRVAARVLPPEDEG